MEQGLKSPKKFKISRDGKKTSLVLKPHESKVFAWNLQHANQAKVSEQNLKSEQKMMKNFNLKTLQILIRVTQGDFDKKNSICPKNLSNS